MCNFAPNFKNRLLLSLLRVIKAWVLLLLFVVYQVGSTSFVHTHIVNGVTVVHSHLSTQGDHQHTAKQVQAIDYICHYVCSDVPECVTLEAVCSELLQRYYVEALVSVLPSAVYTFCLRGPPAVC